MSDEIITTGPTVEDAVDAALTKLGVRQDAVDYEVLSEPSKGLFGAAKPAEVRVWTIHEDVPADDDDAVPAELLKEQEVDDLSDEDLDKIADAAVASLKVILGHFGIDEPTIEEYEGDEGEIILDVVGGDLGLLIGRHGRTLDALQTAVGAVTTRTVGFRYPVVVDVEGYRHRRRQKIEDIARRAADRAARQKSIVKLRPMTAYERRIVHVALRNDRRVSTSSEGAEPYRQVVISPK